MSSDDSFFEVSQRSLRERAMAWDAVCRVLNDAFPGWHYLADSGMDSAVAAIRRLRPEVTDETRRQIEWAAQKLTDQYGENGDEAAAIIILNLRPARSTGCCVVD